MDVLRPTDEEGGVFTKRTLRKGGMVHCNNTGHPHFLNCWAKHKLLVFTDKNLIIILHNSQYPDCHLPPTIKTHSGCSCSVLFFNSITASAGMLFRYFRPFSFINPR